MDSLSHKAELLNQKTNRISNTPMSPETELLGVNIQTNLGALFGGLMNTDLSPLRDALVC